MLCVSSARECQSKGARSHFVHCLVKSTAHFAATGTGTGGNGRWREQLEGFDNRQKRLRVSPGRPSFFLNLFTSDFLVKNRSDVPPGRLPKAAGLKRHEATFLLHFNNYSLAPTRGSTCAPPREEHARYVCPGRNVHAPLEKRSDQREVSRVGRNRHSRRHVGSRNPVKAKGKRPGGQ